MDCMMDDGSSEGRDLMRKLDDDTLMHVLSYLTCPIDVARASAVSHAWRRLVRDGQLWKRLCTKSSPQVENFVSVSDARSMDRNLASGSSRPFDETMELEHDVFRALFRELHGPLPCVAKSCIKDALVASSTDNYPDESIKQTLYPRPKYNNEERIPSYWSSEGQQCPDVPETLTYQLVSRLCVVHEVKIRPFKAFFQFGSPVYSARNVRIRLGSVKGKSLDAGCDSGAVGDVTKWSNEDFSWTYVSPEFPMEQVDTLQTFKLPSPVLCVGGILQVELLGRVQTQQIDNLYYICVCHVMVTGRPLLDFDFETISGSDKYRLKYSGDSCSAPQTHPGKDFVPEGDSAARNSSWNSLADRIRQLRTSRGLHRNRLLLNTLLGNFAMASLLLSNDPWSSEDDEEVEYHSFDGTGPLTDEHSADGGLPPPSNP